MSDSDRQQPCVECNRVVQGSSEFPFVWFRLDARSRFPTHALAGCILEEKKKAEKAKKEEGNASLTQIAAVSTEASKIWSLFVHHAT